MSETYEALTVKERRFVDFYIGQACGNAAEAARLAGYAEGSAKQAGHRLRQKADIREAISEQLRELAAPAELVVARLSEQAQAVFLADPSCVPLDGGSGFEYAVQRRDEQPLLHAGTRHADRIAIAPRFRRRPTRAVGRISPRGKSGKTES